MTVITTQKMAKYAEYKYSGEGWIGAVPKKWDIVRLKHIFKEKKITHNPKLNCGSISFGKVVYKDDDKVPISTKASYQEVLKDEYLINPLNLNYDLISLRIALSDKNVVVSSGYIVLQNHANIDKSFYKWLLHRYDVAYMKLLGSGVRQTINFNHIANSLLPLPPLKEQTAIANFLDEKTTKIDQAIAQKEQLIELLKERKQILIQNAVTKGLNPNVKLKPSGVEWIGDIPEHWEVKRLKYLVSNVISGPFGSSLIKDEYVKEGYKIYGQEQVIPNNFSIGDYYITEKKFNRMKRYRVYENDILVSCVGTFGKIALVPKDIEDGIINPRLIKMAPKLNIIMPTYLHEILLSRFCFKQFEKVSRGGTMGVINIDLLSKLIIILPSNSEQVAILKFIKKGRENIDNSITINQTQIKKLKEYKATIINSAVTGKIKVC